MSRNFEGDLDRERLKDRTADVTSTWRTCVGDGRVRVPPVLEHDIFCVLSNRWNRGMTVKHYNKDARYVEGINVIKLVQSFTKVGKCFGIWRGW
jgi:hypothetical protein